MCLNVAGLAPSAAALLPFLPPFALAGPTVAALARPPAIRSAAAPAAAGISSPARSFGVSPLRKPTPPRFMKLAGVTGLRFIVSCGCAHASVGVISPSLSMPGGAGGGIERSTGLGVSLGTPSAFVVLPRCPRALLRSSGVELALFEVRPARFGAALLVLAGAGTRIAGACVERRLVARPSPVCPLGEGPRLPDAPCPPGISVAPCACGAPPCVAPNQGLVIGEMSRSKLSTGAAEAKTRFAGAEFHMCGGS